jgi:tRNA uridine 5-carbamoylmethylation protein Kti12
VKRLILMQGCSGSGKSTIAELIKAGYLAQGATVEIHSTDNYFMSDGKYKFNPKLLGVNHGKNQQAVVTSMDNKVDVVIVDNTNTKKAHVKPYIDSAAEHKYDVQVVRVTAPAAVIAFQNGSRSSDRRIPDDVIVRQALDVEDLV